MSYNISSDQLNDPIIKELLTKLREYFDSIDLEFYIIGATARNIILSAIHHLEIKRATSDLDIAIAIPDWSQFDKISSDLDAMDGFEKSKKKKQLFWYNKIYELDIVPFGEIAKEDHSIYWPPEEEFAMSVIGFTEIVKDVISVIIDDELEVNVASLPGIFVLKLAAYKDRGSELNKHADDIAFIIANYLEINEERAVSDHYDLYAADNFTIFISGATLLGRDTKKILSENPDALSYFVDTLQTEIDAEEESLLINQIIETHTSLKYDEIFEALQGLLNELK